MIPPRLAKDAIRAALEFQAKQLWTSIADNQLIGVRLPGQDLPLFLYILGNAGKEFGFLCFRGDRAIEQVHRTHMAEEDDELKDIFCDHLTLTFDAPGSVPAEARTIAATAGLSDRIIPLFLVLQPNRLLREARSNELRLITTLARALMLAEVRGLLRPLDYVPGKQLRVLMLTVRGEGKDLDVAAKYETVAAGGGEVAAPPIEPPTDFGALPRLDASWVVGLMRLPARVANDDRPPYALLVGDEGSHQLLEGKVLLGDDVVAAAQALFAVFGGVNVQQSLGVPKQIAFGDDRLLAAVGPILEQTGTHCTLAKRHEFLDQLAASLAAHLQPHDPNRVPAAEDCAAWEQVMAEFHRRILATREASAMGTVKPRSLYFGQPWTQEKLEELGITIAEIGFQEWFLLRWRATPGKPTLIERLLGGNLPEPVRLLAQAHVDGRIGIYRVDSIRAPRVELTDICTNHKVAITDAALAGAVGEGTCFPGKVCQAAGFDFFLPLGPPLPLLDTDQALEHLEALGFTPTGEGLRTAPEQLGRLWSWVMEEEQRPVQITNTDGDPIAMQTATYLVEDELALRRAFEAREDIDAGNEVDEWIWHRKKGEERTLLARLQVLGDQLLVEINSDVRLAKVRAWLDRIQGIRFLRVKQQDLDEDLPLDSQLGAGPEELPPEALDQVRQMLDHKILSWLDESVPMLGGKTPREASKTPTGREKVRRMILTMPDPAGIPGYRAPREELLRRLGMEGAQ